MITLTPAGLYTHPSNRESKFLIKKVPRSAVAKNTLETKRRCFTNTLTFHMSTKYNFFCAEIIVEIPDYEEHKNRLQLSSSILTFRIIRYCYWRAQENGGSGFQDKPWDHNFRGVR